eukprot:3611007-Rhodomonas_salina.1
MAGDNDEEGEELRQEWLKHMRWFFSISDDCELKWYLGVKFDRQADGSVKASQEAYLDRCLKRYGLQDAAPAPTPMDA